MFGQPSVRANLIRRRCGDERGIDEDPILEGNVSNAALWIQFCYRLRLNTKCKNETAGVSIFECLITLDAARRTVSPSKKVANFLQDKSCPKAESFFFFVFCSPLQTDETNGLWIRTDFARHDGMRRSIRI